MTVIMAADCNLSNFSVNLISFFQVTFLKDEEQ